VIYIRIGRTRCASKGHGEGMHYNTETTLYMSEGEIVETLGRIRGMIKRLRERGGDTLSLEWDLCYVQREADMRQARADAWRQGLEAKGLIRPEQEATSSRA